MPSGMSFAERAARVRRIVSLTNAIDRAQRLRDELRRDLFGDAEARLAKVEAHAAELAAENERLRAEVERLRAAEAYFTDRDRAAAQREGAEAMREACVSRCDAIYTERHDAALKRRTHGSRATRDEDHTRLTGQAHGAAMCAEAIRDLPLPGDGEVSR